MLAVAQPRGTNRSFIIQNHEGRNLYYFHDVKLRKEIKYHADFSF